MKIKILGLILLLIATTGFGFHNWHINNNIDSYTKRIDDLVDERNRYIDGFMRYRDLKQEWKVEVIAANIGQLFKRTDLILYKEIRDVSIRGVKTSRDNIRFTKRKALEEFAGNVGGLAYADSIIERFDSARDVEVINEVDYMNEIALMTDKLYLEIRTRLAGKIGLLQRELKEKREMRSSHSQTRDVWYMIFLSIQIIGIALTILGESRTNNKAV